MALPKGAKAFNVIRENSTTVFMELVPSATEGNINEIKNILFNDSYQPQLNEFVNNLVNRIFLTIIENKQFTNPLALFKKGSVPLGVDIQELYTNPVNAEAYELSNTAMADILAITVPDTHVAYYRRNRKDKYKLSISRENLYGAFISWEKFEEYIVSVTTSLYSGNYIDEFEYTKKLVDGAYNQNKVICEVVSKPVDTSTANAFLKKVRALYTKMSLPSTKYNSYSLMTGDADKKIKTWTEKERIVLITTADVLASVDVDSLAGAFQLDKKDFLSRVYVVDEFENDEIVAIMCDESWFKIYENLLRFDQDYNASCMVWQYYLHAWSTFAISPFANAICLTTEQVVPVEEISISDVSATVGTDETVSVTLDPVNATTDITFSSSDPTVFTVTKISNSSVKVVPVAAGTGVLTALGENGVTTTADVTVSASL